VPLRDPECLARAGAAVGQAGRELVPFGLRQRRYDRAMHLRMPSIAKGVQAFLWSLTFFLFIYLGGLAVGVSGATAFVVGLVAAFFIFLLIRTRGDAARHGGR
jgi:hypothetical protein